MSFLTAKFHKILLCGFRGVALTRKTGDLLTDRQVKNIPSATSCVGYKNIQARQESDQRINLTSFQLNELYDPVCWPATSWAV